MKDRQVWIAEIAPTYRKTTYLYFGTREEALYYVVKLLKAMGKTSVDYSIAIFEDSLENYFSREFEYNNYEVLKA